MKYIVSWSGGKDSTATIILAHEHGLRIDLIIICLVWFDKARGIYGEYPEHIKWIFEFAIPLFESWGYRVEVVSSDKDYIHYFYHTVTKSSNQERCGKMYGFLIAGLCKMNEEKTTPIKRRLKQYATEGEYEEYIGIAIDEPERLERLKKEKRIQSLLERYGYTESMARQKCIEYGLLSPLYAISSRGGCWFCPNQRISGFAYLKTHHREYWDELKFLSTVGNTVSNKFKREKTFDDVEREVDEYILQQATAPIQLSIFDMIDYT